MEMRMRKALAQWVKEGEKKLVDEELFIRSKREEGALSLAWLGGHMG